jgi:hypothetical protein
MIDHAQYEVSYLNLINRRREVWGRTNDIGEAHEMGSAIEAHPAMAEPLIDDRDPPLLTR